MQQYTTCVSSYYYIYTIYTHTHYVGAEGVPDYYSDVHYISVLILHVSSHCYIYAMQTPGIGTADDFCLELVVRQVAADGSTPVAADGSTQVAADGSSSSSQRPQVLSLLALLVQQCKY